MILNIFPYMTLKSYWELLHSHKILLRVIIFLYMTLKSCWEWLHSHDFEMLLRVNIFSYMTLKCWWEWIYSLLWLWNAKGYQPWCKTVFCCPPMHSSWASFVLTDQPQFNSEKVLTHKNLSHFTLEKKVIQSNSFCEIDLRRIWARRRLIVFVGVRSDW